MIQLTGGFSLLAGNTYGRVIGIVGASLGAIGALLSIGGANPWWSLGIFALCVYIIHGLLVLGDRRARLGSLSALRRGRRSLTGRAGAEDPSHARRRSDEQPRARPPHAGSSYEATWR